MRDKHDPKFFAPNELFETILKSRPMPPPMPDTRHYKAFSDLDALPVAIDRGVRTGLRTYDETKSPTRAALSGVGMFTLEAFKINDPVHKFNAGLRDCEIQAFRHSQPAFIRVYGEIPPSLDASSQSREDFVMHYMRRTLMNDGYSSGSISRFLEVKEISQQNARADEMGQFFKTC